MNPGFDVCVNSDDGTLVEITDPVVELNITAVDYHSFSSVSNEESMIITLFLLKLPTIVDKVFIYLDLYCII
jgi:hypothetical protein